MKSTVAVLRPDGERLQSATNLVADLGAEPLADPMLTTNPTGRLARTDADYTILTSTTGVGILAEAGWEATTMLCAIGSSTAGALREAGYEVDIVPEEFSSAGLVDRLRTNVAGARVEIARSDSGSDVLPDGLEAAGAYVHETELYTLARPPESGESAVRAAEGTLGGVLFTSPLTVEHFLDAAEERASREAAIEGLESAIVGCIGGPTRTAAEEAGIEVDVVPAEASAEQLARAVIGRL